MYKNDKDADDAGKLFSGKSAQELRAHCEHGSNKTAGIKSS